MRTKFIQCDRCHAVSYNPFDIHDRWCGRCKAYTDGSIGYALVSETDPLPAVKLMQPSTFVICGERRMEPYPAFICTRRVGHIGVHIASVGAVRGVGGVEVARW